MIENIQLGLSVALSVNNLAYCFLGVFLGTLIGVIPGVGALATITLLFPITYHLDPTSALIMMAGIFYGSTYGGSTASILLNLPGTPTNAVTCVDGYPMAKQGRAGVALFMTTIASFIGGSFGIFVLMAFSPLIVQAALSFGSQEYFSLMVLGLIAASVISGSAPLKALSMVVLGIVLGVVGTDIYTGTPRFTFRFLELMDGISLVALSMGLFGVAEVIASIRRVRSAKIDRSVSLRSMLPERIELRRSWLPMLRGSVIGSFFGALPGTGGTIAAFMSYATEKRISKEPWRFGNGAIEGVVGPESANNAADQTSFIPTLTLGVPGSVTMALILGIFMIHGVTPGPRMMLDSPDLFWGLVMSFWIGNLLLLVLNIPLIGIWVRILMIPYHLLYPAILVFVCIGVYSVNNSTFDIILVVIFGILGYGMAILSYPAAPLLLGFVLGPMMEEHFRRSMIISRGSFSTFIERPLSLTLLVISAALLAWTAWSAYRSARGSAVPSEKSSG